MESPQTSQDSTKINTTSNGTSIELVSKDGPLSITVMMQEGMKALTEILSNQLRDQKYAGAGTKNSMQFVIKNEHDENGVARIVDTAIGATGSGNGDNDGASNSAETADKGSSNTTSTLTGSTPVDRQSGVQYSQTATEEVPKESTLVFNNDDMHTFLRERFPDSELQINGEDAEIIFDYETRNPGDAPHGIGKKISEMIESVLPGGIAEGGELHITGDVENIEYEAPQRAEVEEHDVPGAATTVNSDNIQRKFNEDKVNVVELNRVLNGDKGPDIVAAQQGGNVTTGDSINDVAYCPYHGHHHAHEGNQAQQAGVQPGLQPIPQQQQQQQQQKQCAHVNQQNKVTRVRNHYYHDFEYITDTREQGERRADFSVLLENHKPVCMFCEYYMVFGEPPRNMIKWYNNTYGYTKLTPSAREREQRQRQNYQQQQQQQQQQHRKRNR